MLIECNLDYKQEQWSRQKKEGHRNPFQVDHYFEDDLNVDNQSDNQEQRYPRHDRRLPERYGVYFCHACGQASSKEGQV